MEIARAFVFAASLVLAGCQMLAVASGKPSGNTRNWKAYRVEVGEHIVHFSIPPGESREFPKYAIPEKIDLDHEDIFDEALEGPRLLSRVWDYRSSGFVPVDGSLSFGISVNRSRQPLEDLVALKEAVEESNRLYALKLYFDEGRRSLVEGPSRFDQVRIGGREGLRIAHKTTGSTFVLPLDRYHYLGISTRQDVLREDWRADAKAAASAFISSIQIEPQ